MKKRSSKKQSSPKQPVTKDSQSGPNPITKSSKPDIKDNLSCTPVEYIFNPETICFQIENNTYDPQEVNLFSQSRAINKNITINNLLLSENEGENNYDFALKSFISKDFSAKAIRMQTANKYQFEQTINFVHRSVTGKIYSHAITPVLFYEESQNQTDVIDIAKQFKINVGSEMNFILLPKTTIVFIFYDQESFTSTFGSLSAIKIKNKTNKTQTFNSSFTSKSLKKHSKFFEITPENFTTSLSVSLNMRGGLCIHKIYHSTRRSDIQMDISGKNCHKQFYRNYHINPEKTPPIIHDTHKNTAPCDFWLNPEEKERLSFSLKPNEYLILGCSFNKPTLKENQTFTFKDHTFRVGRSAIVPTDNLTTK